MSLHANLALAIAVPIFVLAASIQRVYVTNSRLILLVVALILFTIGNTVMVRVMRDMGLGVAISLATIAQLILVNVIAYAVFEERPTATQVAGIALGAVSMTLMLWPRGQTG